MLLVKGNTSSLYALFHQRATSREIPSFSPLIKIGSLIRDTFDLSKYFTNSLTPPSYESTTFFSFSSLRSTNSIFTPEFKKANSLKRCSKILKSYFIFENVSSDAQNLTSVPFLSPAGPISLRELIVSPLLNST